MLTKTYYRSPIKLLSLTPEETVSFSADVISSAKNRASETSAINKEELELYLKDANPSNWPFHRFIYEQEGLLQFLETGMFDAGKMRKALYLSYNPSFVQFVSLPFAQAFNEATRNALNKEDDYALLNEVTSYSSFILPAHYSIAYDYVTEWLQSLTNSLQVLSWEQFVRQESLLDFVFCANWKNILMHLPADFEALRTKLFTELLNIAKRFRLDASVAYLKAYCAKLHLLTNDAAFLNELKHFEAGFSIQPAMATVTKSRSKQWIYYLAGGLFILLAGGLFLFFKSANSEDAVRTEDKYMDAVASTPVTDQLNSSTNEHNLKAFLYLASRQENGGSLYPLKTGATPLPGVTRLPKDDGNSSMTVKNNTGADAVLFYFGSDNPLVDKHSRVVAVYIKSGEEYQFRFQPDFGRFNFMFGKGWSHLAIPPVFPIYKGSDINSLTPANKKRQLDTWMIKDFFRWAMPSQPLLNHDITITNVKQVTSSNTGAPTYTLLNEAATNKKYSESGNVNIELQDKEGQVMVKAQSSLYVYLSPQTFDTNENNKQAY